MLQTEINGFHALYLLNNKRPAFYNILQNKHLQKVRLMFVLESFVEVVWIINNITTLSLCLCTSGSHHCCRVNQVSSYCVGFLCAASVFAAVWNLQYIYRCKVLLCQSTDLFDGAVKYNVQLQISADLSFWIQTYALLTFMSLKCSDTGRWEPLANTGFCRESCCSVGCREQTPRLHVWWCVIKTCQKKWM